MCRYVAAMLWKAALEDSPPPLGPAARRPEAAYSRNLTAESGETVPAAEAETMSAARAAEMAAAAAFIAHRTGVDFPEELYRVMVGLVRVEFSLPIVEESVWFQHVILNHTCDFLFSIFAFTFNLYRYVMAHGEEVGPELRLESAAAEVGLYMVYPLTVCP